MRKLFIAAGLLAAQAAMAQSSLTIYGVVDSVITRSSGQGTGHRTGLGEGGLAASRIAFKGREDLGGGYGAGFLLDGGIQVDDGTSAGYNFTRQSLVSLYTPYGEFRLGRDYTPTYWLVPEFAPFKLRGVGKVQNVYTPNTPAVPDGRANIIRQSNSIGFLTPEYRGLYGQVQYALGEQPSNALNSGTNDSLAFRAGYHRAGFRGEVAAAKFKELVIGNAASTGGSVRRPDLTIVSTGARYDFGSFMPMAYYSTSRVGAGSALNGVANSRLDTFVVGFTAPVGPGLFRAEVGRYNLRHSADDANQYAVGYIYNLSKRTALYGTWAMMQNKGKATYVVNGPTLTGTGVAAVAPEPGGRSTGLDLGIRHIF